MVKNEKGVTLLILVITIIVLFILMGVSFNTGYSTLTNVRAGRVIANMNLIKIKIEDIYEEAQFDDNESLLVGVDNIKYSLAEILNQNDMPGIKNEFDNYSNINTIRDWYEWDEVILKSQGLDTKILKDGGKIFVNYEDSEVIYTKGATVDNNQYYYTLTALENAFETE